MAAYSMLSRSHNSIVRRARRHLPGVNIVYQQPHQKEAIARDVIVQVLSVSLNTSKQMRV